MSVKAMADFAASCAAVPILGWALNSSISCTISSELKQLYSSAATGSTTQLLERLAYTESSYDQFFSKSLKQPQTHSKCSLGRVIGLWPHENFANGDVEAGDFIGLMQVPNSETSAWNWITNVTAGAKVFNTKLKTAQHYRSNRRKEDTPEPADLTASQLEDLALGVYKGFGRTWYWVPHCSVNPSLPKGNCAGGTWQWVKNPTPCIGNTTACIPDGPADNVLVQVDKVKNTSAPCEM